mmetsp:Transcript_70402/g.193179  ORF Transcript_70402/g.193179 Transcript_70402/m.193179 type:complete len:210 (-) Transcript_70402:344-973(-)|eukprot:4724570-Prymnesium_polylepis.2
MLKWQNGLRGFAELVSRLCAQGLPPGHCKQFDRRICWWFVELLDVRAIDAVLRGEVAPIDPCWGDARTDDPVYPWVAGQSATIVPDGPANAGQSCTREVVSEQEWRPRLAVSALEAAPRQAFCHVAAFGLVERLEDPNILKRADDDLLVEVPPSRCRAVEHAARSGPPEGHIVHNVGPNQQKEAILNAVALCIVPGIPSAATDLEKAAR